VLPRRSWDIKQNKDFFEGKIYPEQNFQQKKSDVNDKEDKEKAQNELKLMSNIEEIKDFYEYTEECLKTIAKIVHPQTSEIQALQNTAKFSDEIQSKKIVIFDLDETLVHCDSKSFKKSDVVLTVNLPTGGTAQVGVNVRPHLYECLKEAKKNFMIIAYTASHQAYADTILNYLDPKNEYFSYRLYRNNCIRVKAEDEQLYVKDLRIFKNLNLSNLVIIDNSVLSFSFHLDNGIPILPYYDNKEDTELLTLINYLNHLSKVDDIRVENKKYMSLDNLLKQNNDHHSPNEESIIHEEEPIRLKLFVEEADFYSNGSNKKSPFKCKNNNSYLSDCTNSHMSELSKVSDKSDFKIDCKKTFEESQKNYRSIFKL